MTLCETFFNFLGLKRIHALTIQSHYELRVEMEDFENSTAYAQYGTFGIGLFSVDPERDSYPLTVAEYTGTAGLNFIFLNKLTKGIACRVMLR